MHKCLDYQEKKKILQYLKKYIEKVMTHLLSAFFCPCAAALDSCCRCQTRCS